ncbi:MAG: UDPGP type 1 family protein [Ruminococcus sp.]|uniref:UDPGP type 1 family protein n=1 Tax=Ruminococcus sp. TaxID=41978 RepID=UPI001B2A83A4|nr:UDPGP type 1 family protein [Ruminococcus sp.]MBO7474707.1 UDPGP type 1 family protein [Ruminococcus sp.]
MISFEEAKKQLSTYKQEHLLRYYDELDEEQKRSLLMQIEKIDFSILKALDTKNNEALKRGVIEPIEAVSISDIAKNSDNYHELGIKALKDGKIALVLLAGGQGTRLGFDKPKGMFNIGVTHELFIFECLINNIMKVVDETGKFIHLCIMTSEKNNEDTVGFFREKNYFGYNADYVHFFVQDMAPAVDFNGKIYMEAESRISSSPNGNGGWFSSLVRSGLLDELKKNGAEWLNVFGVDNVLAKIADPLFIGAIIKSGAQSGSKVVPKSSPEERVGVMCLEDGRPSIVEYYEMTGDMITQRNSDGELAYKYGVILNYLFSISKLEEINKQNMPIHTVDKKIPYMNDKREYITPSEPNGHKFEKLILDMINMHDSCIPYEVIREKEFAPIKNPDGADSVVSARKLLEENGVAL